MGVGLGDDPDAGPPGVAEHDGLDRLGGQGLAQQRVGDHGLADRPGVVAELADLGGRLVDQAQVALGGAHGERAEQRVGGAGLEHGPQRRRGQVEAVAPHEQVEPGAVAAAHLEAVDGGEGLVHGEADGHPGGPDAGADEPPHTVGGAEAVTANRPHGVLQRDQGGVDPLELGAGQLGVGVEAGLDLHGLTVEALDQVGDGGRQARGVEQRRDPGDAPQEGVGRRHLGRGVGEHVAEVGGQRCAEAELTQQTGSRLQTIGDLRR